MASASVKPTSTVYSFLMVKKSGSYEKLVDIKGYPDMGGKPEGIECTTLSDSVKKTVPGVQDLDELEFTANYTPEDFAACKAYDRQDTEFSLWLGGTVSDGDVTPDGSKGKFDFTGQPVTYLSGGDVNAVREMKIAIALSSEIAFKNA